ncbi:glycosyltransferase [Paenibacillus terrigena]|uniref:tetratricopeptide repeat-containing glycosyltransferase family 2 protein n=1 Tax=Paenibacillus terrigena TaxID=369333 RepID=UPI0028D361D0|nr:glycosyltransferase [Paenibacillus terrigena]
MNNLLSLCMIVKDEENVIRRCLESVKGLVDEIIIIDTGSTDQTKEIASEYTSQIYDFTWINDFSAAKNEAIRYATSTWILVLDADEYVQPEGHQELREMLSKEDHATPQAFMLPILNIVGHSESGNFIESLTSRIFNNHPEVYFHRPIHEQIQYTHGNILLRKYPFSIFHTGYTDEVRESKNKTERNLAIFSKLKEYKKLDEYDYFTLGNEYYALGDFKKALYYYNRADTAKVSNHIFMPLCKYKTILTQSELDNIKDALEITEDCISRWPQYVDFVYLKASYLYSLGFYNEAIVQFQRCIDISENCSLNDKDFWLISPSSGSSGPYKGLLKLHLRTQQLKHAVVDLTKLIELKNDESLHLFNLVNLLLLTDEAPSIIKFLDQLYPDETPANVLRLFQVSLLIGNNEFSTHFYNRCLAIRVPLDATLLRTYALITNNEHLFMSHIDLQDSMEMNPKVIDQIVLAICIWNNRNLIDLLPDTEQKFCSQIVDSNLSDQEDINVMNLLSLLLELFKYQYYDIYDAIINRFPLHYNALANHLGDYFYDQHQFQLAIDYYSTLLQSNELSATGYENIAQLYLNQSNTIEAIDFLKKTIEITPNRVHLYILLLQYTSDSDDRKKYSELFINRFPKYKGIPLIKKLLV